MVTEGGKCRFQNSINIRTGVRSLIKEGSSNASGSGEIERPQKGHTCQPSRTQKSDKRWPKKKKLVAYKKEIKNEISAIKAGHSESEETITDIRSQNL